MVWVRINTKNLQAILSGAGGFWTAISSLTFLFLSMFLYESMLKQQARLVWERYTCCREDDNLSVAVSDDGPDNDHVFDKVAEAKTVQAMKSRLSFVSLYTLYEDCEELK